MAALLYVLAGQYEHAGVLGELVIQADQASVAQALGGDPAKAMAAPKHALQRKLLEGLRYLLKEELKLNQPQASDGWLTQDALWLVSKTVSDKLRAYLLSQGIEGIPSSNTAVLMCYRTTACSSPRPTVKQSGAEQLAATPAGRIPLHFCVWHQLLSGREANDRRRLREQSPPPGLQLQFRLRRRRLRGRHIPSNQFPRVRSRPQLCKAKTLILFWNYSIRTVT